MPQATPPALRDIGVLRLGYAGAVAVRVLLGYRALAARKDGFSESVYAARLSRHHARSARRIYHSVLRLQGLMIKIGQTLDKVRGEVRDPVAGGKILTPSQRREPRP